LLLRENVSQLTRRSCQRSAVSKKLWPRARLAFGSRAFGAKPRRLEANPLGLLRSPSARCARSGQRPERLPLGGLRGSSGTHTPKSSRPGLDPAKLRTPRGALRDGPYSDAPILLSPPIPTQPRQQTTPPQGAPRAKSDVDIHNRPRRRVQQFLNRFPVRGPDSHRKRHRQSAAPRQIIEVRAPGDPDRARPTGGGHDPHLRDHLPPRGLADVHLEDPSGARASRHPGLAKRRRRRLLPEAPTHRDNPVGAPLSFRGPRLRPLRRRRLEGLHPRRAVRNAQLLGLDPRRRAPQAPHDEPGRVPQAKEQLPNNRAFPEGNAPR
jgi:hypothetical protein